MARVELAQAAVEDLERLIVTHSLPPDTKERVKHSLRSLEDFPYLGAPLEGRWAGFRFLLGPWVLAIGLMRYAFLAAGRVVPWLRAPVPSTMAGKIVAVTQGVVLLVAAAGVLPLPVTAWALAVALAALVWSFGWSFQSAESA